MKNTRIISLALIATILISTITCISSCNKKNLDGKNIPNVIVNEVEKVAADSLWFDYSTKELEFVDDPAKYLYYYIDTFYPIKDGYVALFAGATSDTYEPVGKILMYDQDLNLTDTLEILPDMLGAKEVSSINVSNLTVIDGKPCALVNSFYFDENTYESESKCFLFDIDTQKLANIDYLKEKVTYGGSIDSFGASSEGYVYVTVSKTGEKSSFDIIFGKDGSFVKSFDVSQTIGRDDIWGFHFMNEEDGILYFECRGDDYTKYLEIDTANFSTKVNDTYEQNDGFVNKFYHSTLEVDGKVYSVSQEGILCDDEVVMPFNATYANKSYLINNAQILVASDDKFVLLSKRLSTSLERYGEYIYTAYTFNRAESNPNAGKTILTAGYVSSMADYIPEYTAEAISVFNKTNENYFVKAVPYATYNTEYDFDEELDRSDYWLLSIGQNNQTADKLMLDILSGEGPDIILDAFEWAQLDSENYLYDLSDVLNEIDVEVFDNVMEAAKVDGKLYQMPLGFGVNGIFCKPWIINGEVGFTFEEYAEYVDKKCNGTNPIKLNRSDFLKFCMICMSDEFFDDDGNVNFQNDAFYKLAEYCLNNVPEKIVEIELVPGMYVDIESEIFDGGSLYTMQEYFAVLIGGNCSTVSLCGVPSIDGRGPNISVLSSIAISAGACDYEGAKEFLKIFFGSNSEQIWKEVHLNPIVVSACDAISKNEVDVSNMNYDDMLKHNTEAELNSSGIVRFDYDVIEDYKDILRSASTVICMDTSIQLIVMEEIPAYFAGQKTIEEVAAIIDNRAQTVIDERG